MVKHPNAAARTQRTGQWAGVPSARAPLVRGNEAEPEDSFISPMDSTGTAIPTYSYMHGGFPGPFRVARELLREKSIRLRSQQGWEPGHASVGEGRGREKGVFSPDSSGGEWKRGSGWRNKEVTKSPAAEPLSRTFAALRMRSNHRLGAERQSRAACRVLESSPALRGHGLPGSTQASPF